MIKKVSQLDKIPENFYNDQYKELGGPDWEQKKNGLLFEVSYLTANTATEAGANEVEYYKSYQMTLSALSVSVGIDTIKENLAEILSGGVHLLTGELTIGSPGEAEMDRLTADGHTYRPSADDSLTCYSKFNLENDIDVHGLVKFHNNVVLTCDKDVEDLGKPILEVTGVSKFNQTIYGTALNARWGDLAEFYDADEKYEPGTLVCFGGEREITIAKEKVNAVVTANPGVVLNGNETEQMMIPTGIALTGRVKIKVLGPVKKFDNIVLSRIKPGVGEVYNFSLPYEIIGKALEDSPNAKEKLVLCATNLNLK